MSRVLTRTPYSYAHVSIRSRTWFINQTHSTDVEHMGPETDLFPYCWQIQNTKYNIFPYSSYRNKEELLYAVYSLQSSLQSAVAPDKNGLTGVRPFLSGRQPNKAGKKSFGYLVMNMKRFWNFETRDDFHLWFCIRICNKNGATRCRRHLNFKICFFKPFKSLQHCNRVHFVQMSPDYSSDSEDSAANFCEIVQSSRSSFPASFPGQSLQSTSLHSDCTSPIGSPKSTSSSSNRSSYSSSSSSSLCSSISISTAGPSTSLSLRRSPRKRSFSSDGASTPPTKHPRKFTSFLGCQVQTKVEVEIKVKRWVTFINIISSKI